VNAEIRDAINSLKDALGLPPWAITWITVLLTLRIVYKPIAEAVEPLLRFIVNRVIPLFYTAEKQARVRDRRIFADHVESEIRKYNTSESWADHRFAELEAEVEVQDTRRGLGILATILPTGSVRREKSLTRALRYSSDREILLVGDPGSGKSVALRHLAQGLARKAMRSRRLKSTIPIYVNLKEFPREPDRVDAALVKQFILSTINRANDRDVALFLDENFDTGMKDGSWLFLLDSFDEIPELLSSTEMDEAVQRYTDAMYNFLHGMKRSRGIIASREYRSPSSLGRARFRILPLTDRRKAELLQRAKLSRVAKRNLLSGLENTDPALKKMSENPLFLSLLCEYMRQGNDFPENSHIVFENYIKNRFDRDNTLLTERFTVEPARIRQIAEELAFCMVADHGLGLNPDSNELQQSMARLGLSEGPDVEEAMEALTFIKLARSERRRDQRISSFTFAHRRFQEYFSTCLVIREPWRVTPADLINDGRWREAAVTICQTQTEASVAPLLMEAENSIDEALVFTGSRTRSIDLNSPRSDLGLPEEGATFLWPQGALHVLGVIDAGFASSDANVPSSLREKSGRLLAEVAFRGRPHDCRWALEVISAAPQSEFLWFVTSAFRTGSSWLREAAFRQIGRLEQVPADLARDIRRTLLTLSVGGRLRAQSLSVTAQLKRIERPHRLLATKRLLLAIPWIDFGLHLGLLVLTLALAWGRSYLGYIIASALFTASLAFTYTLRACPPPAWPNTYFRPASLLGLRSNSTHASLAGTLTVALTLVRAIFILLGFAALFMDEMNLVVRILGGAFIWVSLWSPGALLSAVQGKLVEPWWWPLHPVLVPAQIVVRAGRLVSSRTGLRVACLVIIGGIFIAGVAKAWNIVSELRSAIYEPAAATLKHWLSWTDTWQGQLTGVVIVGLLSAAMIIEGIMIVYRWVSTWVWLYKWSKDSPDALSGSQLLAHIRRMRSQGQLVRLLQTIRTKQLIKPDSEALAVVDDLFVGSEHMRRVRKEKASERKAEKPRGVGRLVRLLGIETSGELRLRDLVESAWPQFRSWKFHEWINAFVARGHGFKNLWMNIEVVDELSRIVDDLERSQVELVTVAHKV
jgi:hypothetical protein